MQPPTRLTGWSGWSVAAAAILVVGLGLRLSLAGGGVGARSASVMILVLSICAWTTARLLGSPRLAFLVMLVAVAALDLAALPARKAPEYDDRQAFFRTDQVIAGVVPNTADTARTTAQPVLVLLVEPVFPPAAAQPAFGLAGEVASAQLAWDCPFQRGLQHLALSLSAAAAFDAAPIDVRLHLTGSPSRETDYLLVYASAPHGGFLMSLTAAADTPPTTATCSLHS